MQSHEHGNRFFKKYDPYDKFTSQGHKKKDILRKMGLDNKNDYKWSNVNAHDVWFKEKEDRKIQPIFKDNTGRQESHIYNRNNAIVSQKFYDADYNHTKPRLLDSVIYKSHPPVDIR